MEYENLTCDPSPDCLQWPHCYKVVVDEIIVCSGIYYAMIASLPDAEDYIVYEIPVDEPPEDGTI